MTTYRSSAREAEDGAPPVRAEGLTKRFGRAAALTDVSFALERGRLTALTGPNGSGKTTLLRAMVGLLVPTSGTLRTFGVLAHQLDDARLARLAHVDQEPPAQLMRRVDSLVAFVASHYPRWDQPLVDRLLESFRVERHRRVSQLAPGSRQSLFFALALGHRPELLLFDEPTAAMDPESRAVALDELAALGRDPTRTIVVSSHLLGDLERVAQDVMLLHAGRLLHHGPLATFRAAWLALRYPPALALPAAFEGLSSTRTDDALVVHLRATDPRRAELEAALGPPLAATAPDLDTAFRLELETARRTQEAAA